MTGHAHAHHRPAAPRKPLPADFAFGMSVIRKAQPPAPKPSR